MGDYPEKVHGTDGEGKEVTASFGKEGTSKEGTTYLSDGHKSDKDFWGSKDNKGHDDYNGKGGGTERGQYTGEGSKEDK